jgi:branched-chain amino acid transport system substrate-binding protein
VGFKDAFERVFQEMGGTVATSQAYSRGDQDFSAQLTTIREARPDAVLVPGYYTDAANIAIQARRLGVGVPLLGGDGWDSAQLAAIGGDAVLHTFYSNHYAHQDPRPEVQGFIAAYGKRHGGELPDSVAALSYDAARILFAAMDGREPVRGRPWRPPSPPPATSRGHGQDLHGRRAERPQARGRARDAEGPDGRIRRAT